MGVGRRGGREMLGCDCASEGQSNWDSTQSVNSDILPISIYREVCRIEFIGRYLYLAFYCCLQCMLKSNPLSSLYAWQVLGYIIELGPTLVFFLLCFSISSFF